MLQVSDEPAMLSTDEAKMFLTQQLKLHEKHNFTNITLSDLEQIVRAFHMKIPFQNITLLAQPPGTQDVPSCKEIKRDMLAGLGGLCYTNNVFMTELLRALGLHAEQLAGTCNLAHPNNHILTSVKHLTSADSIHLVDVGCGYPTYQTIPVDFDSESPVYTNGFLKYKFTRNDSNRNALQRVHLQDFRQGSPGEDFMRQPWERFYDFDLVVRGLEHFHPAMSEVYRDRFLRKLRVLVFEDQYVMAVKEQGDTAALVRLADGHTHTTVLRTDNEILAAIKELVPNFDVCVIKNALDNWRFFRCKVCM